VIGRVRGKLICAATDGERQGNQRRNMEELYTSAATGIGGGAR
jgi:hypothetical protein